MARILVVDDEKMIRSVVRKYAEFEGFEVEEADNGEEAVLLCRRNRFDTIVMDIMMEGVDGISACRRIRAFSDVPVIMLSARVEEYDRIHGLEAGADDYVVKPFSPKELILRIKALTARYDKARRTEKQVEGLQAADDAANAPDSVYRYRGLIVNPTARTVFVDEEPRELTYKGFELLLMFIRNKGIALSREQILTEIWGFDYYGDDRTLDTHVKMLRNQMGPYRDLIVTLRGMGYRFEEKEE